MSFSEKGRKLQSETGKLFQTETRAGSFAVAIGEALRSEFGNTPSALKSIAQLTHPNERPVRNWFQAKNGPSGENLIVIMR